MASMKILGVILAGGLSRRMGGKDKFLLPHNGKTLLEWVITKTKPQVQQMIVCANGDLTRYPNLDIPLITDDIGNYGGPLAGVISAMRWAREQNLSYDWLASLPSDSTNFPDNWVARCQERAQRHKLAAVCAGDPSGPHYTYALWSPSLIEPLQDAFNSDNRSLKQFFQPHQQTVEFFPAPNSFVNINTPQDWDRLQISAGKD